ncbi:Metal tolerance protein 4 [Aphelenchoides bicaudatus]|nr:Metal tolerance protein 4 [Aphelenchoides bicaudatus]
MSCKEDDERTPLIENGNKHSAPVDERFQMDPKGLGYFQRRRRMKKLKEFYDNQDHLIELYKQDAETLSKQDAKDIIKQVREDKKEQLVWDRRFASVVVVINILIFVGNLTASILSGSYSIISALIDSTMDIMTSIVVHLTIYAINNTDPAKYPRGRQRLELISVIGCSTFMGAANLMMIIQSVQAIVTNSVNPDANLPTILIILSSISTKIVVMIVCYRHAKFLALDQRNDIVTNIVALTCAYVGDNFWKYADPVGAILICSFVAMSWFRNAISQIPQIVGRQVEKEEISRILAITLAQDEIKCLDHMMVYYNGERALVELHIVLDEHLPLKITHDICEDLQDKINSLNFVERSFIHLQRRICVEDTIYFAKSFEKRPFLFRS